MNSNEFESYLTASQVEMYRNLVVSAQSALLAKTTFVIDHNLIAKQAVDQAQATINTMGYGYQNYPKD